MKAAVITFIAIIGFVHSAAIAAPAGFRRCKEVVTDANYKAERMNCPTNQLCSSNYWQYTMTLDGGQTGCYIGSDDFGQFRFDLNTTACTSTNQVLTATYSYYKYAAG